MRVLREPDGINEPAESEAERADPSAPCQMPVQDRPAAFRNRDQGRQIAIGMEQGPRHQDRRPQDQKRGQELQDEAA